MIVIDDVARQCTFTVEQDVRAVQWDGYVGFYELKDGLGFRYFDEIAEMAPFIAAWGDGENAFIPDAPTPEPEAPAITRDFLTERLASRFAYLRSSPVANNFEADDLKLCAEFSARAAEGDSGAIQALIPLADASGVSVEDFIESELARESARRARVLTLRAAQITFERQIDAASEDDFADIDASIAAYSA